VEVIRMKKVILLVLVLLMVLSVFCTGDVSGKTIPLPKIEVVKGAIESVSVSSIRIGGKDIGIEKDTVLRLNGKSAIISDIKVGMQAIAICENIDNKLVARLVLVFNELSITKTFTISGIVTSISQNAIVVSGKTIGINADTKVRLKGKLVSLSEIQVGDRVIVHGEYSQDVYVAKEILIISHKEFEMRTYITEIGSNYIKVKDFDYQIFVNDKTSITKVGIGRIAFTDLKVGDPVQIHARFDSTSGNYLATSIVVLAFKPKTAVAVGGTISFIDLENKTLKLSELPLITFKFPQDYKGKIKITDLKVGDRVLILGKYVDVSTVEILNIIAFKIRIPKKP